MDSILRAALVYLVLLVLFRVTGKRSLSQTTTFDFVLLLIVSEAIQEALLAGDQSMTNAYLVVGTLLALGMEARRRKSNGLEALAFAPMVIPDIVLAVALLSFFSRLNVTLGLHSIIISHVIFDLAFVCSVVRARLNNFD